MLKVATVLQEIITELSEGASENDRIMVITKMIFNETKWLLEFIGHSVIAFSENGIWKWLYEFSKQLQHLHIDVALLSETHLKPHERCLTPNYHLYRTHHFLGRPMLYVRYVTLTRQSLFIRDKPILSSQKMLHKVYDCKGSFPEKKALVVILKGLGPKMT
jgi:hypothetical protein